MFKYFSICAAFLVLGTSSLHAQEMREAVLEKVALPGAGFDILVAVPKSPPATIHVSPEGAIIPLVGGELALGFESWEEFVRAFDQLRSPVGALYFKRTSGGLPLPAAIYVVPADRQTALSVR
jgi:hypothetical protein